MRGLGLAALACCVSMIRSCSHGGRARAFFYAHYAIVLPEPFQNGTSLVMPVVRGKIRVHMEMIFPKEGGYFRLTTARGITHLPILDY